MWVVLNRENSIHKRFLKELEAHKEDFELGENYPYILGYFEPKGTFIPWAEYDDYSYLFDIVNMLNGGCIVEHDSCGFDIYPIHDLDWMNHYEGVDHGREEDN